MMKNLTSENCVEQQNTLKQNKKKSNITFCIEKKILQQWNKSFTPNFSFIANFISQQIVLQIRLFNVIRTQINQNPCLDLKVS